MFKLLSTNCTLLYNTRIFTRQRINRTRLFCLAQKGTLASPLNYDMEEEVKDTMMHCYIYKNFTNLGSNSDALGGSPAPSTIQENSGDPLLWIVFELEVMISFSRACRIFNQDNKYVEKHSSFTAFLLSIIPYT